MEPQWYLSSDGKIYGPMSTAGLEQLFRENRVGIEDQIRLVESEQWMSAPEVYRMFAQANSSNEVETPAAAAARLLNPSPRHFAGHEEEESDPGFSLLGFLRDYVAGATARFFGKIRAVTADLFGTAGGAFGMMGTAVSDAVGMLPSWRSVIRSKLVLAGLTVAMLTILLRNYDFKPSDNQVMLIQMTALGEELEQLRSSPDVTPAQWSEFQEQSLATLEPALKALNESASRGHPLRQTIPFLSTTTEETLIRGSLLEAGHALRMMIKAQGADLEAQYAFNRTMDAARLKLLSSPSLVPGQSSPGNSGSKSGWMLLTGGLLVVGAAIYIGWKRFS